MAPRQRQRRKELTALQEHVEADLDFLKENDHVLAVLLYGSHVKGTAHQRSDIDICIVAPDIDDTWNLLTAVYTQVNTEKKNYDIHIFEDFSLRLQHRVITQHEVVWTRDYARLQEYFYRFRKLWKDQAKTRLHH